MEEKRNAKSWVKINVRLDSSPLDKVLRQIYGAGWAFGHNDAQLELNTGVGVDWSTWKAGNAAASALMKPPAGLENLLYKRGATINGLDGTTLDILGNRLADALDQGLGMDETADLIDGVFDDPARSMVVARTETARAVVEANRADYEELGLTEWEWLVGEPCDLCAENAGESVPIGEEFPSGDVQPPAHPNCVCDVRPINPFDMPIDEFGKVDKEFDPDQPRDESGRWTGSGMSDVTSKINEKTSALKSSGAKVSHLNSESKISANKAELRALAERLGDADEVIKSNDGFKMTEAALNYNTNLFTDEDGVHAVTLHDADGNLAGAAVITVEEVEGLQYAELHYLGTTGVVDGAGSYLYGDALQFAAERDLGISLTALNQEAQNFWQGMGFKANPGSQVGDYLYLEDSEVKEMAGKLNG